MVQQMRNAVKTTQSVELRGRHLTPVAIMMKLTVLSLVLAGFAPRADSAVVRETLVIQEWVVDFLRPTVDIEGRFPWEKKAERKSPFHIDDALRSAKYLVNGTYPGPTIRCAENGALQSVALRLFHAPRLWPPRCCTRLRADTLEITVINELFSEATTIHWHGIHMPGTPYMDGARSVTQGPIGPGENFTYRFSAWPPGTHYYHSHMGKR